MVNPAEVAAFTSPIVASIVGAGLFIGWLVKRSGAFVQAQVAAVQNVNEERFKALTDQLSAQVRVMEQMQKQSFDLSVTVARIEGKLAGTEATHKT